MSKRKVSPARTIVRFSLGIVLVVAALLVFMFRQDVSDQIRVWSFTPSSEVVALTDNVGFTQRGERIFYATAPEVSSSESFNEQCPRRETASPIVGCYTSDDRVYIYNITNTELAGIREVTTAHEMLHAAWFRMSDAERKTVGAQLQDVYNSMKDADFLKRMAYYQRTEPEDFLNELHSIIGTEIATLPEALDKHYGRYFIDRQKLVAYHAAYSTTFQQLQDRVQTLRSELTQASDAIAAAIETYRKDELTLRTDITRFNERAGGGDFGSMAEFTVQRQSLVDRTSALDASRESINGRIASYNAKSTEYNTTISKLDGLNKSLDSYESLGDGPSVQ